MVYKSLCDSVEGGVVAEIVRALKKTIRIGGGG